MKERCAHLKPGEVILLENLRFHNEETGNDVSKDAVEQFRNFLSSLADVYVQDAFATMHRTHSSIIGIDIPIRAAGLLMMKELDYFSEALESPQRPLLAIIGGSSLMAKKDMIRHLITKVDMMIIAGAPAFTMKKFLNNIPIGSSVFNEDLEPFVKEIEVKMEFFFLLPFPKTFASLLLYLFTKLFLTKFFFFLNQQGKCDSKWSQTLLSG